MNSLTFSFRISKERCTQRVQNISKDRVQRDLKGRKRVFFFCTREGLRRLNEIRFIINKKVESANQFLPVSLDTKFCFSTLVRFQQNLQGQVCASIIVSDGNKVEEFMMNSNQLSLSKPHVLSWWTTSGLNLDEERKPGRGTLANWERNDRDDKMAAMAEANKVYSGTDVPDSRRT